MTFSQQLAGAGIGRRAFLAAIAAGGGALGSPARAADPGRRTAWRRLCPVCIDCHAHFLNLEVLDAAVPHSPSSGFGKFPFPRDAPMMRKMLEPALQIEDMDKRGVDKSMISSAAVIEGLSFARGDEAVRLNRRVNDTAADWVSRYPKRFIGSFVLPLADMDHALAELDRAHRNGLKVANLPAQHAGDYLGHARFAGMWDEIDRRGIVAFIHPDGVTDPWFQSYAMWNSIGQSIEEVRVMTSLIYEGALERRPGLKIVMAHGGGYMPHYMGRLDRNAEDKPATMANISQKPSAYLRRFHYDSCVYDPRTLELLVERVGIDRIVMGGDYPVASQDPVALLESIPSFTPENIAAIAGLNAAKLLGV
jgi:aminocarboxymuconate-semialdehyde decarboxylase